jgi:hypothetical protein
MEFWSKIGALVNEGWRTHMRECMGRSVAKGTDRFQCGEASNNIPYSRSNVESVAILGKDPRSWIGIAAASIRNSHCFLGAEMAEVLRWCGATLLTRLKFSPVQEK